MSSKTSLDIVREVAELPQTHQRERLEQLELSPQVRAEVEEMLGFGEEAKSFLSSSPPLVREVMDAVPTAINELSADWEGEPSAAAHDTEPLPLLTLANYELVREISRGGQAVVFEAVQKSTGQKVAVKVLKEGALASSHERARLDREVQVLTALNHPNIVRILDRGTTAEVALFVVMEFITGRPLDQYLDVFREQNKARRTDPSGELRLFLKICDAVNAAHLRGIVHRDLKPSNIRVDENGEPHVLDFGLAHAGVPTMTDEERPQPVSITGQFLGSLPWASPEQAEGIGSKIDLRSDVYSLGVILYQMLTGGKFPYEVAGTMREVLNAIVSASPTPPSQILASHQAEAARKLRRNLRHRTRPLNPIIDAIVLKALAKRRDDRYQNAGELARDVGDYLSGRPTLAGGIPASSRAPWMTPIAMAAIVIASCAVGAVVVWSMTQRPVESSSTRPVPAGPAVVVATSPAVVVASAAVPAVAIEPATLPAVVVAAAPASVPVLLSTEAISPLALVRKPAGLPGLTSWTVDLRRSRGNVAVAYSPDGKQLATTGAHGLSNGDGLIRIYDADTLRLTRILVCRSAPKMAGWSPDGRRLIACLDNVILIWDVAGARISRTIVVENGVTAYGWTSDATVWAVTGQFNEWDISTGDVKTIPLPSAGGRAGLTTAAFAPQQRLLALARADGTIDLMNLKTAALLHTIQAFSNERPAITLCWSPGGDLLAGSNIDSAGVGVQVWDPAQDKCIFRVKEGQAWQLVWLADHALAGTVGPWAFVYDRAKSLQLPRIATPRGNTACTSLSFSQPCKRLAFGHTQGDVVFVNTDDWSIAETMIGGGSDSHACKDGVVSLEGGRQMVISPEGNVDAPDDILKDLIYVAQKPENEQVTLTPDEFAAAYGWRNDPAAARRWLEQRTATP